jgi:bis(5'-nucleosyl)-tetraphosphatase (symmetrical)
MATYLIGDIQGCYSPLQRLLDKVRFDPSKDKLWCCGDVVHRGGQSLEVLRLLHSLGKRVKVTLGNHDLFLLSENVRFPQGNTRNREFRAILQAHDRKPLINWLQKQPLAHWSDKHQLLVVHAGVVPQWTAEQALAYAAEVQDVLRSKKSSKFLLRLTKSKTRRWKGNRTGLQRRSLITSIFTRIRFCDANGKVLFSASGPPGSQPSPYLPWFKHKKRATRDVRIAFGHWAAMGLCIKKRYIALDSGCVWGGRLSAYRLQDGKLFQVPGRKRK